MEYCFLDPGELYLLGSRAPGNKSSISEGLANSVDELLSKAQLYSQSGWLARLHDCARLRIPIWRCPIGHTIGQSGLIQSGQSGIISNLAMDPIWRPHPSYLSHIWWSYMMITYDDHMWWSYMIIIHDDHRWWSYMMIRYDGHIWPSHAIIIYDHHVW